MKGNLDAITFASKKLGWKEAYLLSFMRDLKIDVFEEEEGAGMVITYKIDRHPYWEMMKEDPLTESLNLALEMLQKVWKKKFRKFPICHFWCHVQPSVLYKGPRPPFLRSKGPLFIKGKKYFSPWFKRQEVLAWSSKEFPKFDNLSRLKVMGACPDSWEISIEVSFSPFKKDVTNQILGGILFALNDIDPEVAPVVLTSGLNEETLNGPCLEYTGKDSHTLIKEIIDKLEAIGAVERGEGGAVKSETPFISDLARHIAFQETPLGDILDPFLIRYCPVCGKVFTKDKHETKEFFPRRCQPRYAMRARRFVQDQVGKDLYKEAVAFLKAHGFQRLLSPYVMRAFFRDTGEEIKGWVSLKEALEKGGVVVREMEPEGFEEYKRLLEEFKKKEVRRL